MTKKISTEPKPYPRGDRGGPSPGAEPSRARQPEPWTKHDRPGPAPTNDIFVLLDGEMDRIDDLNDAADDRAGLPPARGFDR